MAGQHSIRSPTWPYYAFLNYTNFNLDTVHAMISLNHTLFWLSDGGAHVGTVCDASFPTYNVVHWVRDRTRGTRFSLQFVVRPTTSSPSKQDR